MTNLRWILIPAISTIMLAPALCAQQENPKELVKDIVQHELKADAADHSRWMYLDKKKTASGSTLKLVVETPNGNLSRTLKINGKRLTPQQRAADQQRMQKFVTEPSVREQQRQNDKHDDQEATSLTKMLPDGFLWTITGTDGDLTTLAFQPNPKFNPPSREAKVFGAMKGSMVVNTKDKRIKSLKGTLIDDVTFGWFGILGRLNKGGTFNIERRPVGDGVWSITETHVHINGHALLFKTISENEDEEKSHIKPAPKVSLAEAETMLNDGQIAKELGIPHEP
jgi:hypothetical protein